MEKLISCCGLDCATCDARIATISNNDDLRTKTAEAWSAQFSSTITAEMINLLDVGKKAYTLHIVLNAKSEIALNRKDLNPVAIVMI